ncbi:MAG: phosphodiester glycosidase family protein [Heliobacteriaceae bacterium]|jgi:exopolysaccharide biosynthesis protein|nr:phosphodiester glycosidase family protein [Heliobacteriaceae bacterium]
MDTVIAKEDFSRLIETIVNFSIIGALILSQNLFTYANDVRLARLSIPIAVEDTGQARLQNFEDSIRKKYRQAVIYDVDSGVKHIKLTKYYNGKPVRINIVEADLKIAKDLKLTPALSSAQNLQSRRTISTIAKDTNAVVALNGTFFKPQTGVPLGTLMINRKMYTGPIYDRAAMGIFENGELDITRVQLNASVKSHKQTIKVDNINQPRMLSSYVLVYTPDWGSTAPPSPVYGKQIAVSGSKVTAVSASPLEIPKDGYVIVGPAQELDKINTDKEVELNITTTPEWKNVKHIISGGPYLVKDGEVFVDMSAQKLAAIGGRNPRSAIGYTAEGNLIMAAVDGREGSSVGMTLTELANLMKSIGCVGAMNLDGGGSTVMYVNGQVVNRPQQTGGIPVSNAIVLAR